MEVDNKQYAINIYGQFLKDEFIGEDKKPNLTPNRKDALVFNNKIKADRTVSNLHSICGITAYKFEL